MPWRAESGQTQIQVVPGSMGSRDQGSETTGGAGCLPGVRLPPRGQVYGWALWLAGLGVEGGCSQQRETPGERRIQNPVDTQ